MADHVMSPSHRYEGTLPRIRAVLRHRALYEIGGELDIRSLVGRPPVHPPYVLLAFATMARITRSAVRVETDLLDPDLWGLVRGLMVETIRREGLDLPAPGRAPPAWHHWRRLRDDHLATDEGLAALNRLHLPLAVDLAHSIGLLNPHGPGSFTHPQPARAVYGDGTDVRPIYSPPTAIRTTDEDGQPLILYPDPATGALLTVPPGRYDPDIAEYHGHTGSVLGHGYVAWHTRGPATYQRVVLGLDHVDQPGHEAATAVRLLGDVHRAAGDGIQVVIYDGAMRGTHIDQIMTRYGYLTIASQPAYRDPDLTTTDTVKTGRGKRQPSLPLGVTTHPTAAGPCAHTIAAVGGAVAQIDLDETGDPVVRTFLARGAVKRARRSDGRFHFNVGYRIPCPGGDLDVWLSPHPQRPGDPRPEHLRVLPDNDPDTMRLKGLRSDAESVHSQFKRTLITDRAMSLGWRRGLIDYYCYAWYSNALTEQRARAATGSAIRGQQSERSYP
jgi:hypothetical protein